MRVVGLISGGKDSCFNMMQCIKAGHEIVALANLYPADKTEIDSYMYQSVGFEAIELIAEAMELPLFRKETLGVCHQNERNYTPTDNDEVEDLFQLLSGIRDKVEFDAVSVGAILSDYQRIRVENVCSRLNLVALAYLWQRDQLELLDEMIKCEVDAIVIKVAALGLEPSRHLGRSLRLLEPHLHHIQEKYGVNVCGEGGEYETLTIDCPLYKSRIVIDESEIVIHSNDPIVGYLKINKLRLELKLPPLDLKDRFVGLPLKDSDGYVTDYGEEATELNSTVPEDDDASRGPVTVDDIKQKINSARSGNGWVWVGGVTGDSQDAAIAMKEALEKLKYELSNQGHDLKDITSISLFVSDMGEYAKLNARYCEVLNHLNPPSRACVQVPLPGNCPVILQAISWNGNSDCKTIGDQLIERHTMHVQSISHWAPANIGPYSQAVKIGDIIHLAGQIGMIPGNMKLAEGIKQQCQLALRHVGRLLKASDANATIRDVVQGFCYVSDSRHVDVVRRLWEESSNNAIMDYFVVSNLPRGALVEWHVWAHMHNNQFEYEETGKNLNGWAISIYRRYNYENNIASIVCHIDHTAEAGNGAITIEIFKETLEYALHKLQQGHEYDPNAICSLTIFYPPAKISGDFTDVVEGVRNTVPFSYTIVPVVALKCDNTHVSICGIRNQ